MSCCNGGDDDVPKTNPGLNVTEKSKPTTVGQKFKVLVRGDKGVGKTSLICRSVGISPEQVLGSSCDTKDKLITHNGSTVLLNLWDLPDGEQGQLPSSPWHGTAGALLVFDLTSKESFVRLSDWTTDLQRYATENVVPMLVGNKCDLPNRVVTNDAAQSFADGCAMVYVEVSALKGTNLDKLFTELTTLMMKKI